jgi:transcriptional regulator with XRE-family HTH domain
MMWGMKTSIYEQLLAGLKRHHFTQCGLAKDIGVSQSTIGRVLGGQVSPTLAVTQALFDWVALQDYLQAQGVRARTAATEVREQQPQQAGNQRRLRNLESGAQA